MATTAWSCTKCTFLHRFPFPRCQMCGNLRDTGDYFASNKSSRGDDESSIRRDGSHADTATTAFAGMNSSGSRANHPYVSSGTITNPYTASKANNNPYRRSNSAPSGDANGPNNTTEEGKNGGANRNKRPREETATTVRNPYAKHKKRDGAGTNNEMQQSRFVETEQQDDDAGGGMHDDPPRQSHPSNGMQHDNLSEGELRHANGMQGDGSISLSHPKSRSSGGSSDVPWCASRGKEQVVSRSAGPIDESVKNHRVPPNWMGEQNNGEMNSTNHWPRRDSTASQHASQDEGSRRQAMQSDKRMAPLFSRNGGVATEGHHGQSKPVAGGRSQPMTITNNSWDMDLPYEEGPIPLSASTSHNWIFPTDDKYPERSYQLQMARASLMANTLVCLPTGLGKTLIAAVVMYNYYRWFPEGKVVFCAPNRPLVTQQIQACYNIMGIPERHTAEIVGAGKPELRRRLWESKRAFFCTPHTLVNDINEGRCDAKSIVCVVMDEAHRATGNHPNALLVDLIKEHGAKFRLVALSATPGTDIKSIQKIIHTLNISQIEAKTEDDPDVKQYIHHRAEEKVIVYQPTAVDRLDKKFGKLIQPLLDRLRQERIGGRLFQNTTTLQPYTVLEAKNEYVNRTGDHRMTGHFLALQKFVSLRISLKTDGVSAVRTKMKSLDRNGEKGLLGKLIKEAPFQSLLAEMCEATLCTQVDENEPKEDLTRNNPKYAKLLELLELHFQRGQDTRVIIFAGLRDSVDGIVSMLQSQNNPALKPHYFLGQSNKSGGKRSKSARSNNDSGQDLAGMNQVQQQRVLGQFNQGIYNILVCTSVGEEGLDIGEVDLIFHFDIVSSSIRAIQRSGRTGRKRDGRVIYLVSEGAEERAYEKMMDNKKRIVNALKSSSNKFKLCSTPPMLPSSPTLLRQKMTVSNFRMSQVGGHTPNASKRSAKNSHGNKAPATDWVLTAAQDEQRQQLFGDLPESFLQGSEYQRHYLKSRERSIVIKQYRRDGDENAPSDGSSTSFLKCLEKKYLPTSKTLSLSPLDEALANFQCTPKNNTDCISIANDDASIYLSNASPAVSLRCDSFEVEDLADSQAVARDDDSDALDAIFGVDRNKHISKIDGNDLLSLFDCPEHKNCAVSPPPGCGMTVSNESDYDESDDDSSVHTKSSHLSVNTQNDDLLCDFFDSSVGKLERHVNDHKVRDVVKSVHSEVSIPKKQPKDVLGDAHVPPSNCMAGLDHDTSCDHQYGFNNTFEPDSSGEQELEKSQNTVDCKSPVDRDPPASCKESGVESERSDSALAEAAAPENAQAPFNNQIQRTTDHRKDISSFLEAALSSDEFSSAMQNGTNNDSTIAIVALQLPTPPDSSDDSDSDDSFKEDTRPTQKAILDESNIVFNEVNRSDAADISSAEQVCATSFQIDESFDAGEVSHTVVPLQLPTQYSSSSSDEDSEDEANVENNNAMEPTKSGQVNSPINLCHEEVDVNLQPSRAPLFSSLKNITNLANQSLSCDLVDSSAPKNVKFNAAITHMSPDDLTDTPVQRSNLLRARLSSDELTDTPAKSVEVQGKGPKKLRRKRLRPAPSPEKENQQTKNTAADRQERVKKRIEEKYRCRFLDTEAALDGSDEDSDEEDDIRNIEEEEAENSFINDSSQLGYTQDDLDRLNADEEISEALQPDDALLHRQLDHKKNVAEQFKTPIFNRKMMRPSLSPNVPTSQRGLGNMNFIKSVLEHHRRGGDADEIEEEYHRLAGKCSHNNEQDWGSPISIADSPKKQDVFQHPSTASADKNKQNDLDSNGVKDAIVPDGLHSINPINKPPAGLTAGQKAMIEAKRLAALKRRQERMQQQQQPAVRNPYAK